jgi:hypothetical protein
MLPIKFRVSQLGHKGKRNMDRGKVREEFVSKSIKTLQEVCCTIINSQITTTYMFSPLPPPLPLPPPSSSSFPTLSPEP